MKIKLLRLGVLLALLSTINSQLSTALAQGTAFTYQGRLNANDVPASGTYDFRFRLASDSLANNYIGPTLFANSVLLNNGLFTLTLDFGSGIFTGSNYWLEVGLRTNGVGGYSALSPLQALGSTPYATMANSASNLLGTLPVSQLSGTVSAAANFTGSLFGDVTGTQDATLIANGVVSSVKWPTTQPPSTKSPAAP